MKTNDELIEEFAKLHSTNPPTQIITSSRKKVEDWLRTVLTQKDAEVARERERIVKMLDWRNREDGTVFNDGDDIVDWYDVQIKKLITNKGDTNN